MISLTCTNCRTSLSIDDAFAGGVCRCQHCGTIQTVPSHLKRTRSPSASGGPIRSSAGNGDSAAPKALYKRRARTDGSGTGLDELAEIVASSGLGGSGLGSPTLRRGEPPASGNSPKRLLIPALATAGAAIVVLLAVVLCLALGRGKSDATAAKVVPSSTDHTATNAGASSVESQFCGVKLDGQIVIYVLDRGNGTVDEFDNLKEAAYRSIKSLGADRKFQIIFWDNGTEQAYPAGLPAYATDTNLATCRRTCEDITAFGQSDPIPSLRKAIANKANEIVLATAKSDIDPQLTEQVIALRKINPATVHTFALGGLESPVLREVAERSGGEYRSLTRAKLHEFAE